MRSFILPALLAAVLASPGFATEPAQDGKSHDGASHGTHAGMTEGVHAEARINAIAGDTVNVTHGPIPQIGWPAMTMDLKLLEGADTGDLQPGDAAVMMLEKGPDGLYGIRALEKAE